MLKKIIYKHALPIKNEFTLKLPAGSILDLQTQSDQPFLWVLHDIDATDVDRHFSCRMTGHEFEIDERATYKHIGTVQMGHNSIMGVLVAHYFEVFPNAS